MTTAPVIDMHVHVGLVGDTWPELGKFSDHMIKSVAAKVLLLYSRMTVAGLTDVKLKAAALNAIDTMTAVEKVVLLAMDPAYDERGNRLAAQSHMWVANEYVMQLRNARPEKVLFGASVHPYDPKFTERVARYVDEKAVLLKWLPSAQAINLADKRVADALTFLATAKHGKPLPLLLHVGPEHAIPPIEDRNTSLDFLSWKLRDRIRNWFTHWRRPDVDGIRRNLEAGLEAGAVIIFAHCGLPYFAPRGSFWKWFEHSDLGTVRRYLKNHPGRAFADVSAILQPFRHSYFKKLVKLPQESLVLGSDYPVPIFTLPMDLAEDLKDLEEILTGQWKGIVPNGNLIDVNYRELQSVFGANQPMFRKFATLI